MYIIIVGGGRVGESLSLDLTEQGHEVLVIEQSGDRCELLREELGSVVMVGDGCEASTLAEAGAERADVLIAVTDGDEDNLVSCQVAQHRFHVKHIVARVNAPRNEPIFKQLGIDRTANSVEALTTSILKEIPGPWVTRLVPFKREGVTLLGVRIPEHARAVGKRITDIGLPEGSAVSAVVQKGQMPHLPSPDVTLGPDDEVIILARVEDEHGVLQALTS